MTNITHLLTRILALATLSVATLLAPAAHGQSGQKHTTISVPQPSDVPGKIQVLEFFAYSCPHCATMEPMVEAWVKTLPENVVFAGVPVAFNASMADLQKLYYTLDALDRLDLHPKVFDAIHKQRKRIYDAKAITDWAVEQGIDRAQFEAASILSASMPKWRAPTNWPKSTKLKARPAWRSMASTLPRLR